MVVLWHSYNAVAKGAFDDLVMEFNETVGMEQGIIVEPVGYAPAMSWMMCCTHPPAML